MERTTLTKNKEGYGYKYTELAEIHRYLEENDMRYYQTIETNEVNGCDYVMTYRYINGEWETEAKRGCRVVEATLQGIKNPAQQQGSALTYARRYSLLMAFGLATEDNDANDLNIIKEVTQEEADNYKLTFGKFKGMTIQEVMEEKPDYIDWLLGNSKDDRMIKIIELATGKTIPSEEEQQETLNKMVELNNLIVNTGSDREAVYKYYNVHTSEDMTLEQLNDAIETLKKKVAKQ